MGQNQSLRLERHPRKWFVFCLRLARPEGLEPPAYWFEANRSIQLSYGRGSGDCDLMVSLRRTISSNQF